MHAMKDFVSVNERTLHRVLSLALMFISIPTFFVLLGIISAPYGKHSNKKWGPTINAPLAWFLFESPNLIWSAICFFYKDEMVFWSSSSLSSTHSSHFILSANQILLLLFVIHYIHRCIIYPLRMNTNSQPVNITVIISAFSFCCLNGYLQARSLCNFQTYYPGYHNNQSFRIGVIIWLIGFIINIHSDSILLNLRLQSQTSSNVPIKKYFIPRGGLFQYVSSANYLGEVIEWGGFAYACQTQAAFAFWLFVCANLTPRAYSHHQWYKQKFDDYPKRRKAIIPFLW